MNKQKLISIVVGFGVALIVLIGGFLVLQGRMGRASGDAPVDFTCEGSQSQITVAYKNSASKPSTLIYGTTGDSLNFISDESSSPGAISPGTYEHKHIITLLPAGTTHYFAVVGPDGTKYNDSSTGEPFVCATAESSQEVGTPLELPTAVPTESAQPTSAEAGDLTQVIEYYDSHSDATFIDCVSSGDLDGIEGLGQLCIKEYQSRKAN